VTDAEWLRDWMAAAEPVAPVRRYLLFPGRPGSVATTPPSPVVCNCFGLTEARIEAGLARGEKLECGSNCGSCLPEVRAIAERIARNRGTMAA
jgi:assimilatory nitrate reductase catalytic subunit